MPSLIGLYFSISWALVLGNHDFWNFIEDDIQGIEVVLVGTYINELSKPKKKLFNIFFLDTTYRILPSWLD